MKLCKDCKNKTIFSNCKIIYNKSVNLVSGKASGYRYSCEVARRYIWLCSKTAKFFEEKTNGS